FQPRLKPSVRRKSMTLAFVFLTVLVGGQSSTRDDLITRTLRELQEPDLRGSKVLEVYRVVFVPSLALDGPTSIRPERSGDSWILTTSRFSQPSKRGPAQLLRPKTRKLTSTDVSLTLTVVRMADLNRVSSDESHNLVCLDGTSWLYERVKNGKYEK